MRNMMLILLLCTGSASAQTSLTPNQRQAILDYSLTMPKVIALTGAMEDLSKYLASLPNAQERGLRLATMSPADLGALSEKNPKVMGILTQKGLTAGEYGVGVSALTMAYTIAATGVTNNPAMFASPANVAFAKANLAQLKPRMDAVRNAARGK